MKSISIIVLTVLFALIKESSGKISSKLRCKSLCNNVEGISKYVIKDNEYICQCYTQRKITGDQFIKLQNKSAYWNLPFVVIPVIKKISKRQIENLQITPPNNAERENKTLQPEEDLPQTPPQLNTRHLETGAPPINSIQNEQKFPRLMQKIENLIQSISTPEPVLGKKNPMLIDHSFGVPPPGNLKPLHNLLPNLHSKIPGSQYRFTDPILVQPVADPFADTLRKHMHQILDKKHPGIIHNPEHQVNKINIKLRMDQTTDWWGNAFNLWKRGHVLGATAPLQITTDVTPDHGQENTTKYDEPNLVTTARITTEESQDDSKLPPSIIVQPKELMNGESNPTE